MKWQLCPIPPHQLRRGWVQMCVCPLTSLPLSNRVLAIKQKHTESFLLPPSLPRSNDTEMLCLFYVNSTGWYRTSSAMQYLITTVELEVDSILWLSIIHKRRGFLTTGDGALVYLFLCCCRDVGRVGRGAKRSGMEPRRLRRCEFINHVSMLVWSKSRVCMADLG